MSVHVSRLVGKPPFQDARAGWWGYRVALEGRVPFDYWVLGADYIQIANGYVERHFEDECLGNGCALTNEDDPHPDDYYDATWNLVIEDLHASDNPPIF